MPIFQEFLPTMEKKLCWDKQQEILKRIKRDIPFSEEKISKTREEDKLGGEIVDMRLADDGSIRTYVKNKKFPIPSYADSISVSIITIYKHFFIMLLKGFSKQNIFQKVSIMIAMFSSKDAFISWSERIFAMFPVLLKDEHWCRPVKELRRVMSGKIHPTIIDTISLIIEYDSAYKNRFQDVFPLLDQSKLKGLSAIKEVKRVFDILISRDYPEMREKWRPIKKAVLLAMMFPNARKQIISILKEINLKEIEFSEEELYWINQFPSYEYRGMSLRERLDDNIKKYGAEC
jgi:hypothetical protein